MRKNLREVSLKVSTSRVRSLYQCGRTNFQGFKVKPAKLRNNALRMIRFFPQQSVKQRFSRRLLASSMRLDGNEDSVNFGQLLGIVET